MVIYALLAFFLAGCSDYVTKEELTEILAHQDTLYANQIIAKDIVIVSEKLDRAIFIGMQKSGPPMILLKDGDRRVLLDISEKYHWGLTVSDEISTANAIIMQKGNAVIKATIRPYVGRDKVIWAGLAATEKYAFLAVDNEAAGLTSRAYPADIGYVMERGR